MKIYEVSSCKECPECILTMGRLTMGICETPWCKILHRNIDVEPFPNDCPLDDIPQQGVGEAESKQLKHRRINMKKILFIIFAPIIIFTSPFIVGYPVVYIFNFFIEVPSEYFIPYKAYGVGIFVILVCVLMGLSFYLSKKFYKDVIE